MQNPSHSGPIWQEGGDQLARGGRARRRTGRGTLSIRECRPTRISPVCARARCGVRELGSRSGWVSPDRWPNKPGDPEYHNRGANVCVHAATWPPAAFFDTWTSSLAKSARMYACRHPGLGHIPVTVNPLMALAVALARAALGRGSPATRHLGFSSTCRSLAVAAGSEVHERLASLKQAMVGAAAPVVWWI
jgi:hypothetical protein